MSERLGILISGGGTTMAEIIKACQSQEIPQTKVVCIIASRAEAGGIEKAKKLAISDSDIVVIEPKSYQNREDFGQAIITALKKRKVSIVTQNGWLPLTPENVIEAFPGAIFNQHPGPLPEFGGKGMYGRRVHAAVLLFNRETRREAPYTEVVGQRVDKNFDKGAIIKAEKVPILRKDTVEDLQQRALPVEHKVQIEMLKDIVLNRVKEVERSTFMVLPQEREILEEAKKVAVLLYPRG